MKTRRQRRRARGAAMVEGIVVISTMLCFIGLISFARQAYGTKLDFQQDTRSRVFYSASHACSDAPPSGGGGTMDVSAPTALASGGLGEPARVTTSWNMAEGNGTTASIPVFAVFDRNAIGVTSSIAYQKVPMVATSIRAHSKVLCNEPDYGSNAASQMLHYGLSALRNPLGFVSGFVGSP